MSPVDPALPLPERSAGARTTRRRGRMSPAKHRALTELGTIWGLPDPGDPARAFGRDAPLMVDIGCGTGEATRAWGRDHPDADVVAVELHRPGVAQLLAALDRDGPTNVRVIDADATALIERWGAEGRIGLTEVRVLFPDPWPKRRHHRRRLIEPGFVARVADLLVPGGRLHVATDRDDHADHIRSALATEARLVPLDDEVAVADAAPPAMSEVPEDWHRWAPSPQWRTRRPDRPTTTYEMRGIEAGRTITDLVVVRATPLDRSGQDPTALR